MIKEQWIMTRIGLWLFFNDYGYISDIKILFIMLIALIVYVVNLCYVKKDIIKLIVAFPVIIFFGFSLYIILSVTAADIPQYGTQLQKEMLTFCIQEKTENGLTAEDREDIAGTIEYIMKACKKDYDKLEAKHKRELEHKKFLLKNKEILDSLDKMLIEQGVK